MPGEQRGEILPAEVPVRLVDADQRFAGAGEPVGLRGRQGGAGRVVGRAEKYELGSRRGPGDLVDGKAERSIGLPEPHLDDRGAQGLRLQGVESEGGRGDDDAVSRFHRREEEELEQLVRAIPHHRPRGIDAGDRCQGPRQARAVGDGVLRPVRAEEALDQCALEILGNVARALVEM